MADVARLAVEIDPTGAARGAGVAERSIARVKQAARQSRDEFGRFTKSSLTLGESLGSLRIAATSLIGPLGAVFAAFSGVRLVQEATQAFAAFEQEIANLRAVTGATSEELAIVADVAREVGITTRFSATEAAQGLVELAKAGLTTEQQIAALPATLNLATIAQLDLSEASAIVVRSLAQFQLGAEQATRVADVLAEAANASTTDVDSMALALSFVGSTANAVGLDIEQTAAQLAVLANNALDGARGGTALRGVISTLIRPTKEAAQELKRLGVSLNEVDVRSVGLQAALERLSQANLDARSAGIIFGREIAAGALALIQNTDAAAEFEQQLRQSSGAAQQFADIVSNTLQGSFNRFKGAVNELFITIGENGLGAAVRSAVDGLTELAKALAGNQSEVEGLNETIDIVLATFEEIGVSLGETIDLLIEFGSDMVDLVREAFKAVVQVFQDAGGFILQVFNDLGIDIFDVFDQVFGFLKDVANGVIAVFRTIGQIVSEVLMAVYDQVQWSLDALEQLIAGNLEAANTIAANSATLFNRRIEHAFRDVGGRFRKNFEEDVVGQAINLGKEFVENFQEGVDAVIGGDFEFVSRVRENAAARAAARAQREAERLRRRQEMATNAGVPQGGGDVPSPFEGEEPPGNIADGTFGETSRRLEESIRLLAMSNREREKAVAILQFQAEAEKAFGEQLDENDPRLQAFIARFEQFQVMRDVTDLLEDFGHAAADSFIAFARGALSAEEALDAFLSRLAELALQKAVLGVFDAFTGGLSGLFGGLFAEGGRPPLGKVSIVGDGGEPELFVPDQAGTIIPFSKLGQGGGSTSVTVVNVTDPNEVLGALNTSDGERVIMNVIRRNRSVLRREVMA